MGKKWTLLLDTFNISTSSLVTLRMFPLSRIFYFNNQRRHAALGYKSPAQYKTELGFS